MALFKQDYYSTGFFVSVSLGALLVAGIFYVVFPAILSPVELPADASSVIDPVSEPADPLITKIPDLSDVIDKPLLYSLDPAKGSEAAPIKLVIFSDYACEFCRQAEGEINRLLAKYPGQTEFIRKDYPAGSLDSASWQAAIAARCAGEQNQYWPMHDLLFQSKTIDAAILKNSAYRLGLNVGRFKNCLESDQAKELIADNLEEANALEINGVPLIYVNDTELSGKINLSDIGRAVAAELEKMPNK